MKHFEHEKRLIGLIKLYSLVRVKKQKYYENR